MKKLCAFIFICFAVNVYAQTYDVNSVPNTKLQNGSYVSDPDRLLRDQTILSINEQLRALEDSATAQVGVVLLNSIGDADIFTFAQDLFNHWGIGQRSNNNGLLILYVADQRTIRFHTGDGLEAVLPDATCKKVQRDFMVPRFKEQNIDRGFLDGINAVVSILTSPRNVDEIAAVDDGSNEATYAEFTIFFGVVYGLLFVITLITKSVRQKFKDSKQREAGTFPDQSLSRIAWIVTFGFVPAVIVFLFNFVDGPGAIGLCVMALYIYFIGTLFWRLARLQRVISSLLQVRQYFKITEVLKSSQWYWLFIGLIFPIPFLPYFFFHLYRKTFYRNYPRQCRVCNGAMKKLNEKSDDAYLTDAKQLEEKLKSGDYDVWLCSSCHAAEEWFYKNRWSRYEACPHCDTLAYYTKSTRTIRSASYTSSGEGEQTKYCEFCKHTAVTTYTIAQLERSTSSSSGSSFSSGSSGGSWGGGSSSGGGASSSW